MRRALGCSTVDSPFDTDKVEVIKDAFKSARHDARDALLANHPELGAGLVPKGMPPLPPGYSAGSSAPVGLKGLRGSGQPPLPPGYSFAH